MVNDFPLPPPPDEPIPVVPRDIQAKRAVPAPRKAPTIRSGKASIFTKASIPSVYWDGDEPTPFGTDEYTFYREGTPPPDDKGAARAARGLSLYDEERRQRRAQRERRCCGMRMWVFWLLVALIVLVVLGVGIGVGVGVGVGVGSKASQQADGTTARTSASATPTPTSHTGGVTMTAVPTISSTSVPTKTADSASAATASATTATTLTTALTSTSSTTTAPSPTATSDANAICPDADNTVYHVAGSDKRFLRVCGVEYSGDGGAIDMSNQPAASMGACMEACARAAQCAGVSWGNVVTDAGDVELRCWLKRGLGRSHQAVRNWNFAVLL